MIAGWADGSRRSPGRRWDGASLQRLVIIAIAVALGRGDVAVLAIVVFGARRLLVRFVAILIERPFHFSGSAHLVPSDRIDAGAVIGGSDLNLTAFAEHTIVS